MMVSCPKCGFNQPKDRYCASCGIDMLAYQPVRQPWQQKFKTSWLFQVALLAVVLVVIFSNIRGRIKLSNDDEIAALENSSSGRVIKEMAAPVRDARKTASRPAAQDAQNEEQAPEPDTQNTEAPSPDTSIASSGNAPTGNMEQPAETTASAARGFFRAAENALGEPGAASRTEPSKAAVQRIRISFNEATRAYLAYLTNGTRNVASEGGFSSGTLTDLTARIRGEGSANRGLSPLDGASEYMVRVNEPIMVFKGARDEATGQNIGLTLQITPVANDEQGVQLQVEIMRSLREATGIVDQTFQESFLLTKDGGGFLAGTLPHRTLDADDARLYGSTSVLRVMTSPSFQANNSDLLILIEAK